MAASTKMSFINWALEKLTGGKERPTRYVTFYLLGAVGTHIYIVDYPQKLYQ